MTTLEVVGVRFRGEGLYPSESRAGDSSTLFGGWRRVSLSHDSRKLLEQIARGYGLWQRGRIRRMHGVELL